MSAVRRPMSLRLIASMNPMTAATGGSGVRMRRSSQETGPRRRRGAPGGYLITKDLAAQPRASAVIMMDRFMIRPGLGCWGAVAPTAQVREPYRSGPQMSPASIRRSLVNMAICLNPAPILCARRA